MYKFKRIITLFISIVLIISAIPLASLSSATTGALGEEQKTVTKTAEWSDTAKTKAHIDLTSVYDKKITNGKILFLGGMCGSHSLTKSTIVNSINLCAKYGSVDYYLFSRSNSLAEDEGTPITGSLSINGTLPYTVTSKIPSSLKSSRHSCLYDFADVLANKYTKDYDIIVLESDALRMGMFTGATITKDMKANLLAAAKRLYSLYAQGKVLLIVPPKNYSTNDSGTKITNTYVYNDYYLSHKSSSYNKNVFDSLALMAPEDWLNSTQTARKDYPETYDSNLLKSLTTLKARFTDTSKKKIWVEYGDTDEVTAFLGNIMNYHGYETATLTDVVADGFIITGVSGQYYDTVQKKYVAMPNNTFSYTIDKDNTQKVIGTFNVTNLVESKIRMVINVKIDENNDPFEKKTEVETNNGDAVFEYFEDGKSVKKDTAEPPKLTKVEYAITTTVENGTISPTKYIMEGGSYKVQYAPKAATGYVLDSVKIDGVPVSLTTYPTSYTFSNIQAAHTVDVVYLPTYSVTFDSNGGTAIPGQTVKKGGKATEPADPKKTGYTFDKWYSDEGLTKEFDFDTPIEKDTTLYGGYTEDKHTLSYDANGGSNAPASQDMYISQAAYVSSSEPTRDNYTFEGWSTTKVKADAGTVDYESGDLYRAANVEKADATLFACWSENSVSINYSATTGGSVTKSSESVKVYTGSAAGSKAVADEGYHFVNWVDPDGTEVSKNATFAPSKPVAGYAPITYTAVFAINEYQVTYDMNGHGTQVPSETVDHGSYATEPTDPTADGYTFEGWYTDDGTFKDKWDFATDEVTESVQLHAKWTEDSIPLHYDANGGSNAPADQTMKYTQQANVSNSEPTRTGYTFIGWATSKENADKGTVAFEAGDMYQAANTVKTEATLYACWVENEAEYTYSATTGGSVTNDSEKIGVVTGKPDGSSAVEDYGYDFVEWQDKDGNKVSEDEDFVPTPDPKSGLYESEDYTAVFTKHAYNVTFDTNGLCDAPKDQTVLYNELATDPGDMNADGYTFTGWFEDATCTLPWKFDEHGITKDTVIYAGWSEDQVPLHYDANGGSGAPEDQTMIYSEKANVSKTLPVRFGYAFKGWASTKADADAGKVAYAPEALYLDKNVVKTEATLYAVWSENSTTFNYKADKGGSVDRSSEKVDVISGSPSGATAKADYGYDFENWENSKGQNVSNDAKLIPEKNGNQYVGDTYTAKFAKHVFTVNFDTQGIGTNPASQKVTYQNKATRPVDPADEQYEFYNWYADPDCTKLFNFNTPITADTTVYGGWSKRIAVPDKSDKPGEGIEVTNPEDRFYTGSEIRPGDFEIKSGDRVLELGKDYEIIGYEQNIEVGKSYILVRGISPAFTGVLKIPFNILPEVSPKTGDSTPIAMWLVLASIAGACFVVCVYGKKKQHADK